MKEKKSTTKKSLELLESRGLLGPLPIEQLKDVVDIKFRNIEECLSLLQHILTKEQKAADTAIDDILATLPKEKQQPFPQWMFENDLYYIDLVSDTLPNMLRRALFIAMYSFLEQSLAAICDWSQAWFNLRISANDLYGKGCERSKTYLEKVVGIEFPEEYWTKIASYMTLRNYLVHSGIDIYDTIDLSSEEKQDKGKKLQQEIKKLGADILKIEYSGYGTLSFSHEFLTDTLATISEFLSAIFLNIETVSSIRAIK
jgi:hypothetical protein